MKNKLLKNIYDYVPGEISFVDGTPFVEVHHELLDIQPGDVVVILKKFPGSKRIQKKIVKDVEEIRKYPEAFEGERCRIYPRGGRTIILYENDITSLFDYQPGDQITVVTDFYETSDSGQSINLNAKLLSIADDFLGFTVRLDNEEEKEFLFSEIVDVLKGNQELPYDYVVEKDAKG